MIKILQYGEGNFLRTFVDAYFDCLNKEAGEKKYEVHIVKPIPFGTLDAFADQNNRYHTVLRGAVDGKPVELVHTIDVVAQAIDPFADDAPYYALARDPELAIIVSNTTEAGICFSEKDDIGGFAEITYPAKLTRLLLERWRAGLPGVHLLPVELIDSNADVLADCVEKYIDLWQLPEEFRRWNAQQNHYCNTLVDRIVSGHPRTPELKAHLTGLIGEEDALCSVGEPFGLWAVENKGNVAALLCEGVHDIEVVLTDDILYYKKRKVRVLNGSHTNLVPAGLLHGAVTVYDCLTDEKLRRFVQDTLTEEINPFVSDDLAATAAFAASVTDRFGNPYLDHQLTSIALNSISKWKARVLPTFKDYFAARGMLPRRLTIGFAYLMALYASVYKTADGYAADVPGRTVALQDDAAYLEYFTAGGSIAGFMADTAVWGEDLTAIPGFADAVAAHVAAIRRGEELL
ncbi:MAG: tagaturonate reductase [Oscillospiraceae bacterium]|nr:tagaturonate reductase [Oscillospiraceae bacterium]